MSKYKKTIWVALAVVFVVTLFLLKTTSIFQNKETYERTNQENGLSYGNLALESLVNKDTDDDGILDWEEGLWGTDPTKKETTAGVPDSTAINKLKSEQSSSTGTTNEQGEPLLNEGQNNATLTQTDKFSRELFATVASLSQNGVMDQATIDQLSSSLADQIQNSAPRKVFLISEIKTINNDRFQTFLSYYDALNDIDKKYKIDYTALDVLGQFVIDENNVDVSALIKLDLIIANTNKTIGAMVKMSVPTSISTLHLNAVNALQRLSENLSDIRLYDTDVVVAINGISQYMENAEKLDSAVNNLANAIDQKLNN